MEKGTKEEIQKLMAEIDASSKPGSSKASLILKIGAGYAAMALFTMAALFFSNFNLYALNRTAAGIANIDLPAISSIIKLRASLLAQESYAGKFAIFRDATFVNLFRQRDKESLAELAVLEGSAPAEEVAAVKRLYLKYQGASERLFAGSSTGKGELRSSALTLLAALDALYLQRQERLQAVLKRADQQQKSATRWAVGIFSLGLLLAVWIGPLVTYRIFAALWELQKATHRIAGGDFNYEPKVPVREEISELAGDFSQMAARLKELEQMNQDALPLTRLPGNLAIERTIEERLKSGAPFTFCCASLNHFEEFRDHFGYAKGGELLRVTGYLMHASVNGRGAPGDFVGHAGGDRFVMLLASGKVAPVCEEIIGRFEAEIGKHFTSEQRKAGGIERCDRNGEQRLLPVTTISICAINCSGAEFSTAAEVARAAADARGALQKGPGSSWLTVG